MRKKKFLQQCTLFHTMFKHINVLKSFMIFQITEKFDVLRGRLMGKS